MKVVIVSLLFACFAGSDSRGVPEAIVSSGRLQGKWLWSRGGREFAAFQGIPYAAPPVGDLRFRAPQDPQPWEGVRRATSLGSICTQRSGVYASDVVGKEDCLFLNVYAPKFANHLDVLVFIHGGAYSTGSGNLYLPEFLLDKQIILVTLNYRLGPLGFLTTGDNVIPGNLGLKDQSQALQWVTKNIKAFGGNPNSITVYGQSAGAASAHLHTLSPLSKGAVHKIIIQSGSALSPWAFYTAEQAKQSAARVSESLGCPAGPSAALRDCLLGLPDTVIQASDLPLLGWGGLTFNVARPMAEPAGTEGAFITRQPEEILSTSGPVSDVPIIIGYNAQDAGYVVRDILNNQTQFEYYDKNFDSIMSSMLNVQQQPKELLEPSLKQLRKFYYGNDALSNDKKLNTIDLWTDSIFLWPAIRSVRLLLGRQTSPIYFDEFAHLSAAAPNNGVGVGHADDLSYVFPMADDVMRTWDDVKVSEIMIQLIFNFVSTGNPTLDGSWSRVLNPEAVEYYRLASLGDMRTRSNPEPERMQLWKQLPDFIK